MYSNETNYASKELINKKSKNVLQLYKCKVCGKNISEWNTGKCKSKSWSKRQMHKKCFIAKKNYEDDGREYDVLTGYLIKFPTRYSPYTNVKYWIKNLPQEQLEKLKEVQKELSTKYIEDNF
tara:strand:- start:43 stop:408 length:366 start_codon:yes stop_codon:yes gene_type:complete